MPILRKDSYILSTRIDLIFLLYFIISVLVAVCRSQKANIIINGTDI